MPVPQQLKIMKQQPTSFEGLFHAKNLLFGSIYPPQQPYLVGIFAVPIFQMRTREALSIGIVGRGHMASNQRSQVCRSAKPVH